ncbi:hypothetical protein SH1V18_16950 [Vallitalea longa]|uniref:Glycosyl hydrolase 36 catalytic domain-containing protein n=1 Tax=Vallitalea longa TaxID=2936439 RepID=A0A9W5Y8L7_9FIRM|nr:cellobiose phosphorylase [Vallitalea longa]GKX29215.1 hypothetical protein SH1V18_16950 [Vallitalea longa]
MRLKQENNLISIKKGCTQFTFLDTGDLREIKNNEIMINQMIGDPVFGSLSNIYLRIHNGKKIRFYKLLGINSDSKFFYNNESVKWEGKLEGISYKIILTLVTENTWCYKISLDGNGEMVDVVYGQDISIADKGGVLANELYISQYIDHKVLEGKDGYVVCSRQNQRQSCGYPYLQLGTKDVKAVGYSTDATQFFGKSYKRTNREDALEHELSNENYQYELSYIALQTEKMTLDANRSFGFYGVFNNNYEKAVSEIEFDEDKQKAWKYTEAIVNEDFVLIEKVKKSKMIGEPITSNPFDEEELDRYFPDRILEEKAEGKLLSFFTNEHRHVVMQDKEILEERPSGHIITNTVDENNINTEMITSTNYMYGVFNSQLVVGNTSLNKMLSQTRGTLNIQKNSGQRIYIKLEGKYRILTLPAVYEIGQNYSKWYYKIDEDILIVTTYSAANNPDIILEVESEAKKSYHMIITNQLVMGEHEYQNDSLAEIDNDRVILRLDDSSLSSKVYHNLHYIMKLTGSEMEVEKDNIFYEDNKVRNGSFLTFKIKPTSSIKLTISGNLGKREDVIPDYVFEEEKNKFDEFYKRLTCGFELDMENKDNDDLTKINEIFWWYTHNAMVHYAVPHGLEQPGGAAWGTRDICQGPVEYFMATQHFDLIRNIIIEIFSHQFIENKEWPQWFMIDDYHMQQEDCHGDVVLWPLKVVGDYLRVTGDYDILNELIKYRNTDGSITGDEETLLEHVKHAVDTIKQRFMYNTTLISYAGGDWDDTLQPANEELKKKLVSSWTVALAYQVIQQLGEVLQPVDGIWSNELIGLAESMDKDFNNLLIKDKVVAGFAYFEEEDHMEYMLHPDDNKTGISYRLLPMTRSIISELVTKEQADTNMKLIDENLNCTDGVRLMNRPARYKGGVIEYFKRAEQASNVGREISLNYIHAHIRYIEAVAKLGLADEAWNAMMKINPILIDEKVPNAQIRQSNTYFSSSEGMFNDRYIYQDNFDMLRNGEIGVKGGWRIYSSGPGIYLNQLISHILGIRITSDSIIIDPVLSEELDGLVLNYNYKDIPIKWIYHIKGNAGKVTKVMIDGKEMYLKLINNNYRQGGISIDKNTFENILKQKGIVDIYVE